MQELMLVEKLPVNEKEIQIPSTELNIMQKNQYMKNIESTRNEIIAKLDKCKEFKKSQFYKTEKQRIIKELGNGELKEILASYNALVKQRSKIMQEKINPLDAELVSQLEQLKKIAESNELMSIPSREHEEFKIDDLIAEYKINNKLSERFDKEDKFFESKKSLLQTHYKLMQDALLYYKVEQFKKLLIDFLKLRESVNKIYIPIVKSNIVVDAE